MTGDLYIDGAILERVRANFGQVEQLLGRPAAAMRHLDGGRVGPPELVSKVRDFGEEWHFGIQQLGKLSAQVVDALDSIDRAFTQCDADLAAALRDAMSPE